MRDFLLGRNQWSSARPAQMPSNPEQGLRPRDPGGRATLHLLRTARRTLASAERCTLPPSFQRLQTHAPLSSSRALCPWLSISLSLKPHPVVEHTSRTCPPAQNDSPLFPAQVRRCDGDWAAYLCICGIRSALQGREPQAPAWPAKGACDSNPQKALGLSYRSAD